MDTNEPVPAAAEMTRWRFHIDLSKGRRSTRERWRALVSELATEAAITGLTIEQAAAGAKHFDLVFDATADAMRDYQERLRRVSIGVDVPGEMRAVGSFGGPSVDLTAAAEGRGEASGKLEAVPDAVPLLEFCIDPGDASEETIADVLTALSAYYRAHGGAGLVFSVEGDQIVASELAAVPR